MAEYDLTKKIDFNTLLFMIIGNDSNNNQEKEVQNVLYEEYEKGLKFSKSLTYENFFYRVSPNLNFKNIDKYTQHYTRRIEKEIKQIEILNVTNKTFKKQVDKPEEYVSTIISAYFMKLTLSKVTQLAEKIKKNLNKITSDILIQSENKKFGRLVSNNLPEIVSIKEEENEMFIKQGNFFLYNWIQMKIIIATIF